MPTSDQYVGRREGIGLGIESEAGTPVAPQVFLRWLSQDVMNTADIIENDSAMGVVDQVNDSEVVGKQAGGKIGGKITSEGVGFLLSGFFGLPTTGAASGGKYPHTFNMEQSSVPSAPLTLSRVNPVDPQRHSYTIIDSVEISAEQGGWVEVSTAVKARVGATSSDTILIPTSEKEFTSKHITLRVAANAGAVAGSDPLKVSKVSLTLERSSEAFIPLGSVDPEFDRLGFSAKGEFVVRYTDSQYEADMLNNTIKAMGLKMDNGGESLEFNAGRVRYRELGRSTDKDGIVTQTVSFTCELDTSTGRSIQAILTNTRATYEAD